MKAKGARAKRQKHSRIKSLSAGQVDQALRHILTSTLALYVLKNSDRPPAAIVEDLMDMEIKAAQLVGLILQMQASGISAPKLETTLSGVCCFIPSATARTRRGTPVPPPKI